VGPAVNKEGRTPTPSSSFLHVEQQHENTIMLQKLKSQFFTKSHKLKYHFAWIFTLIMNLSLYFTVNVCIERKAEPGQKQVKQKQKHGVATNGLGLLQVKQKQSLGTSPA
jgi:hypothetical protein